MVNCYKDIINYDEGHDYFDEFLEKMHIMEIFKPIFEEFTDKQVQLGAVKYILYAYSINSDMLTTNGLSWDKLSEKIFKKCKLPDEQYDNIARLESVSVQDCIQKWIRYQNDENFTQYVTFRDLRRQLLSASLSNVKKSSGEVDYATKMQCAVDSKQLLQMMSDARDTFIQNSAKLKDNVTALYEAQKKNTLSVEQIMST